MRDDNSDIWGNEWWYECNVMDRIMDKMVIRFMWSGRWIMRGIIKKDRTKIGFIWHRIISDSSDNKENRYEEKKVLDLRILWKNYLSRLNRRGWYLKLTWSRCLWDHQTVQDFLWLLLNLRMDERWQQWGRKERKIELGMRFGRENG